MNGPGADRCRRVHPRCICPDCKNDVPGHGYRCCWEAGRGQVREGLDCTVLQCPGFEAKEKGGTHADQSQGTAN